MKHHKWDRRIGDIRRTTITCIKLIKTEELKVLSPPTKPTTKQNPMLIILAVRCTLWCDNPLLSISCCEMTSPTPTSEPAGQTGDDGSLQQLQNPLNLHRSAVLNTKCTSNIYLKIALSQIMKQNTDRFCCFWKHNKVLQEAKKMLWTNTVDTNSKAGSIWPSGTTETRA